MNGIYNEPRQAQEKRQRSCRAEHGMELGVKIPTINTDYYSFMGA
ncbi:hypothetical protein HPSH417_06595 [Helicobacter pylori Shi417]|nr:hypothetical protein HPSH417_06595 [Helicobacter pylori Shi417]